MIHPNTQQLTPDKSIETILIENWLKSSLISIHDEVFIIGKVLHSYETWILTDHKYARLGTKSLQGLYRTLKKKM